MSDESLPVRIYRIVKASGRDGISPSDIVRDIGNRTLATRMVVADILDSDPEMYERFGHYNRYRINLG